MDEMNHPSSEGESRGTPSNPQTPKQPFPVKLVAIIATVCIVVVGLVALLTLIKPSDDSSSSCNHQWIEADCLYPKTCRICQETTGDAKGHSFINATCTEPKVCQNCNKTDGKALGHTEVIDASVEPTCTKKGLTEGKHCSVCNEILVKQTEINKLGHDWGNPTCTTPRSCCVCFEVDPNSEPLQHSYMQGECIICGADDPDYTALTLTSTKYNISLEDNSDVAYITMIGGETVTYDIDDTSVVRCEWGDWDGDVIPLTFVPVSSGNTVVTVYIKGYDKSIEINVSVEMPETTLTIDELGKEYKYYPTYGSLAYNVNVVNSATYTVDTGHLDYDGTVTMTVDLIVSMTEYNTSYGYINIDYELYNDAGVCIETGYVWVDFRYIGASYAYSITFFDLEPGDYTLRFYDTYQ